MTIDVRYAVVRDEDGKFIKSIDYDATCVPTLIRWTSQLDLAKLWVAKTAAQDDMPKDEGMKVVKVLCEKKIIS